MKNENNTYYEQLQHSEIDRNLKNILWTHTIHTTTLLTPILWTHTINVRISTHATHARVNYLAHAKILRTHATHATHEHTHPRYSRYLTDSPKYYDQHCRL